ncbi:MAG: CCA tRNA nucleotidyltransferase, partial [Chloroflexi bacterium]|nr:CCA tRNA nucleotidyltransferase [Chloroflexota bacterium]
MQIPAYPLPPIIKDLQDAVPTPQEVYLVGGTVRDLLRGHPIHDVDLVVPRDGLAFARKLANNLKAAFYPLDASRDTGRIILGEGSQRMIIDVAVFRGPTLEDDLRARDFTVNAMAMPLHQPTQLIDPTQGLRDLKDKRLRACTSHAFADDPLRVLRGVRLAVALQFRIEPQT